MPRLARGAVVTERGVVIDGDPVPWHLAAHGMHVDPPTETSLAVLWLPVLIDRGVTVRDTRASAES